MAGLFCPRNRSHYLLSIQSNGAVGDRVFYPQKRQGNTVGQHVLVQQPNHPMCGRELMGPCGKQVEISWGEDTRPPSAPSRGLLPALHVRRCTEVIGQVQSGFTPWLLAG